MYDHDEAEVCSILKDHFPKATDSDASLVWDRVKGYGLPDARSAIEKHRLERGSIIGRPDVARIVTLAAAAYNAGRPVHRERTIREAVIGHSTNPIGDLMSHFAKAWELVKRDCSDPRGRAGARALILRHASMAFQQEGLSADEAEREARCIVELAEGERIITGAVFKSHEPPANKSAEKAAAIRVFAAPQPLPEPAPRIQPPAPVQDLVFEDEPEPVKA